MIRGLTLLVAGLLALPLTAAGADLSNLYDQSTLEYWQSRYQNSTQRTLDLILKTNPQYRERLAGVQLDLPLFAEGADRGNALQYWSTYPSEPKVHLPVLSLKFLDDLSTAYAWLDVNGYALETVSNYVAMVAYRRPADFPGARFPQPLTALIPGDSNPLGNQRVNDLSLAILVSARAFIIGHELGHIYYNHVPYQFLPSATRAATSQANEIQADHFGLGLLTNTGLPPLGMIVYFMAAANWDPSTPTTHPLTGDRLKALAQQLITQADSFARGDPAERARVDFVAKGLATIADDLELPDVRTSPAVVGPRTDLASLQPHKPGQLMAESSRNLGKVDVSPFNGVYEGVMTRNVTGETEELAIAAIFERSGDGVAGRYAFGAGEGEIRGSIVGSKLYFNWQSGGLFGKGILETSADGSGFSGTWGYRDSHDGGGIWRARRKTN
jgi:hypothetical protein